jgi:hypothetical protein
LCAGVAAGGVAVWECVPGRWSVVTRGPSLAAKNNILNRKDSQSRRKGRKENLSWLR